MKPRRLQSRRAFTLIELLVVVAIIALLIAILLPSLGAARRRAYTTQCLSNVRSMTLATQIYVSDWRAMLPYYPDTVHSWSQVLMNNGQAGPGGAIKTVGGYGVTAKLRVCPEAPNTIPNPPSPSFGTATLEWGNSPETGTGVNSSYGLNGWLYNPNTSDPGLVTMASERGAVTNDMYYRPPVSKKDTLIPTFVDANWRHIFAKPNDGAPPNLDNPGPIDLDNHPIWRVVMNRHSNKVINVAFLDAHAESVTLPNLYRLNWTATWTPPNPLPTLPPK